MSCDLFANPPSLGSMKCPQTRWLPHLHLPAVHAREVSRCARADIYPPPLELERPRKTVSISTASVSVDVTGAATNPTKATPNPNGVRSHSPLRSHSLLDSRSEQSTAN